MSYKINTTTINTSPDWIPVSQLPEKSMTVKWLCADGVEDVGFYRAEVENFESFDLRSESPITHWQPLLTYTSLTEK